MKTGKRLLSYSALLLSLSAFCARAPNVPPQGHLPTDYKIAAMPLQLPEPASQPSSPPSLVRQTPDTRPFQFSTQDNEQFQEAGPSNLIHFGPQVSSPVHYPWPPGYIPWTLVEPSGFGGTALSAPRWHIDKFLADDGRWYGPLKINMPKFQGKRYPLNMPLFRHLYRREDWRPANFEDFIADGKVFGFNYPVFRPEPHILSQTEATIRARILGTGGNLFRVSLDLFQGQFAWPPVEVRPHEAALQMPRFLQHTFRNEVLEQFSTHQSPLPNFFHLRVGTGQGLRHILMTQTLMPDSTDLGDAFVHSDLYLFHEGMVSMEGTPRMVLLGGMFLPKLALYHLRSAGDLRVAFPNVFGGFH
ncbi:uncharacterized protein UTRI_10401 [Ustilago trichophora]|uniref:Bacterial surface antigen (D15) domain-containing protein n=1 Tax=Ustilago trichophora TaxID=86804 RepID=A0A5C3E9E2_9BASI|nr:uncharacterized protein UTRI_10401 [Ustilago trichophora]